MCNKPIHKSLKQNVCIMLVFPHMKLKARWTELVLGFLSFFHWIPLCTEGLIQCERPHGWVRGAVCRRDSF